MTLGRHAVAASETARRRAMAPISEAEGGSDPAAPRAVQIVPDLPAAATGKILRRALHTLEAG